MKRKTAIVSLIVICMIFVACGKRFVGRLVDTNHPAWHQVRDLPDHGRITDMGPLDVDFTIASGANPGDYIVTGEFDASAGSAKSWSYVYPSKSKFSLLIASEGMVVDNISFMIREESLSRPLPFKIEFHCDKPIEAIAFWYNFYMRG
jgi:hypothetical protein